MLKPVCLIEMISLLLALSLVSFSVKSDDSTHIAVASNFAPTMNAIIKAFDKAYGHSVTVAYGSSGKLYAQIVNGAPYSLFYSADKQKPELLAEQGLGIKDSIFTYAIGRIALWSPRIKNSLNLTGLNHQEIKRIAIANPRLAPYGVAAKEALTHSKLLPTLEAKLVYGENISQVFQFASSGAADVGLIAFSQIHANHKAKNGHYVVIDEHSYQPILQNAIMLEKSTGSKTAHQFFKFTQSNEALSIIRQYGYKTVQDNN